MSYLTLLQNYIGINKNEHIQIDQYMATGIITQINTECQRYYPFYRQFIYNISFYTVRQFHTYFALIN